MMITPETLPYEGLSADWETQQRYLNGDCWVMALALCERLNLEALVLCDEDGDAVHCFAAFEAEDAAALPFGEEQFGIDVRGWRMVSEIVEEFFEDGLDHDYSFDRLSVEQLRRRVERNYNCSGLAGLPDAQALVEQWLTPAA